MRPRVFPAEDPIWMCPAIDDSPSASMRPRVFPAEDRREEDAEREDPRASMRPRVFPAEDTGEDIHVRPLREEASMRPRVFPAEDRPPQHDGGLLLPASMRPRVFPAEDRPPLTGKYAEWIEALQ